MPCSSPFTSWYSHNILVPTYKCLPPFTHVCLNFLFTSIYGNGHSKDRTYITWYTSRDHNTWYCLPLNTPLHYLGRKSRGRCPGREQWSGEFLICSTYVHRYIEIHILRTSELIKMNLVFIWTDNRCNNVWILYYVTMKNNYTVTGKWQHVIPKGKYVFNSVIFSM